MKRVKRRNRAPGFGAGTSRAIVKRQSAVEKYHNLGYPPAQIAGLVNVTVKTVRRDIKLIEKWGSTTDPQAENIRRLEVATWYQQRDEISKDLSYYRKQIKKGFLEIKRAMPSFDYTTITKALAGDEEARKLIGEDALVTVEERHKHLLTNLSGMAALHRVRAEIGERILKAYGFGTTSIIREKEVHTKETKAAVVLFPDKQDTQGFEKTLELFKAGKVPTLLSLEEAADGSGSSDPAKK